jgi:hypothetical protein
MRRTATRQGETVLIFSEDVWKYQLDFPEQQLAERWFREDWLVMISPGT